MVECFLAVCSGAFWNKFRDKNCLAHHRPNPTGTPAGKTVNLRQGGEVGHRIKRRLVQKQVHGPLSINQSSRKAREAVASPGFTLARVHLPTRSVEADNALSHNHSRLAQPASRSFYVQVLAYRFTKSAPSNEALQFTIASQSPQAPDAALPVCSFPRHV